MRTSWMSIITCTLLTVSSASVAAQDEEAAGLQLVTTDDPAVEAVVFEPYPEWQGEPRQLTFGPDGTLWLWDGAEVWRADEASIQATGAPQLEAYDLLVTLDGSVWAASRTGLYSYDGSAWQLRWAGGAVYALTIGPNGTLVGIGGGMRGEPQSDVFTLVTFSGQHASHPRVEGLPSVDRPTGVVVTPDGVAWVGAVRPGWGNVGLEVGDGVLLRYEDATWEPVRPVGDDGTAGVSGAAVAPDGSLWVLLRASTETETEPHLAHHLGQEWQVYGPADGLPSDLGLNVGPLVVDAAGVVWAIGGDLGEATGVVGFDGHAWTRHLQGADVADLALGPGGALWAAGPDGIYTVRPGARGG